VITTFGPLFVAVVSVAAVVAVVVWFERRRRRDRLDPLSVSESDEIRAALEHVEAEYQREAGLAARRELARLVRHQVELEAIRVTDASGRFTAATITFVDGTVLVLHEPRTLPLVRVAAALRGDQTVRLRGGRAEDPCSIAFAVNGKEVVIPTTRLLAAPRRDRG
jgi:Flp pilus assembly protein TadB